MGRKKGTKENRSAVEPLPSSWDAEDFVDRNGATADTTGNPVEFEERIAYSRKSRSSRFFETIGERAKRSPRSTRRSCYTVRFADEQSPPRAETYRYSRYEYGRRSNQRTKNCYSQREFKHYYHGLSLTRFRDRDPHRTNNQDFSQIKTYYPFEEEASEHADDDYDDDEEYKTAQATASWYKNKNGHDQNKYSHHKRGRKRKRGRPRLHSPPRRPVHLADEYKDVYMEEDESSSSISKGRICEKIKKRVARDYKRICEKATKCLHKDGKHALRLCDQKLSKAAILEDPSESGVEECDSAPHDRGDIRHYFGSNSLETTQGTLQDASSHGLLQKSPPRSRESSNCCREEADRKNVITVSSTTKSVDDTSTVSEEKNMSLLSTDGSTVRLEENQIADIQDEKQAAEDEEEVVQKPRARKSVPSRVSNNVKATLYRIGPNMYTTNDGKARDAKRRRQKGEDARVRKKRRRSSGEQHARMRPSLNHKIQCRNDDMESPELENSTTSSTEAKESIDEASNPVNVNVFRVSIAATSQSEAEGVSAVENDNLTFSSGTAADFSRMEPEASQVSQCDSTSYRNGEIREVLVHEINKSNHENQASGTRKPEQVSNSNLAALPENLPRTNEGIEPGEDTKQREQRIEGMFVKIREVKKRELKNDNRRRFLNQAEKAAENEQSRCVGQETVFRDHASSSDVSPNRSTVGTQTSSETQSTGVREHAEMPSSPDSLAVSNREPPKVMNLERRSVSAREPPKVPRNLESRSVGSHEPPKKAPASCYQKLLPAVSNCGTVVDRTPSNSQRSSFVLIQPQPRYPTVPPSSSSSSMGTQTNLKVPQYSRSPVSYSHGPTQHSSNVAYHDSYVPNQQQLQYSNVPAPTNYCDSFVQTAIDDDYVPRAAAASSFQGPPQNYGSQLAVPNEYVNDEPEPSSHFAQEPRYHELMPPSHGQPQPENYGYTRIAPSQDARYVANEIPRLPTGKNVAAIHPTPVGHGMQYGNETHTHYQQPVRVENQFQPPARLEPRYQQPVRIEPNYSQPVHTEARYQQPARTEAQHQQPVRTEPQYYHNSSYDGSVRLQVQAPQEQRRSKDAETNTPVLRELLAMNPNDYNYPVERDVRTNPPPQRQVSALVSPPATATVARASFGIQTVSTPIQTVRNVNMPQQVRSAPNPAPRTYTSSNPLSLQIAHRLGVAHKREVPEGLRIVANNLFAVPHKQPVKRRSEADAPLYVNPKQYKRILKRRSIRLRMEAEGRITNVRKKYMHESRHLQALRRHQECRGKFRRMAKSVGTIASVVPGAIQ